LTLIVDGEKYETHQLIAAYSSSYLDKKLREDKSKGENGA